MKKTITLITFITMVLISLTSCSNKIIGSWTIEKFENSAPTEQGYSLSNIGTITFNKNGTGEKNISYSVLGTSHTDLFPFKWNSADAAVTIVGDSTEFSKTWIIISNKRNYQQWKSTSGNKVQVLKLRKK